MAGGAEAAKSFLESAFNKSKEVLNSAAESTKGLANSAIENVTRIIPGQQAHAAATGEPNTTLPGSVAPPPTSVHHTGPPPL